MERWANRVAVVTGASSGIGEALAKELTFHGMKVAALARRLDRLQKLKESCKGYKGIINTYKCDVSNEDEIANTFKSIVQDLGPISVLINNAAALILIPFTDMNYTSARQTYETNLIGLVSCTQHTISNMRNHNIKDGHIIFINSIAGHSLLPAPGIGHYCATKHAITSLTESIKNELVLVNMDTRVTSISPGLVQTDMADTVVNHLGRPLPVLSTKDIVDCTIFVLGCPPKVNVTDMIIQPVGETISSFQ